METLGLLSILALAFVNHSGVPTSGHTSGHPVCSLKTSAEGGVELTVGTKKMPAPVVGDHAAVKSCQAFKSHPDLWAVELNLGEGSVNPDEKRTDLLVVQVPSKGHKSPQIIYQKLLSLHSATQKLDYHYSLQRSKSGDAEILWKETGERATFRN